MGVSNSLEQLKNGLVQNLKHCKTHAMGASVIPAQTENVSLSHEENNVPK